VNRKLHQVNYGLFLVSPMRYLALGPELSFAVFEIQTVAWARCLARDKYLPIFIRHETKAVTPSLRPRARRIQPIGTYLTSCPHSIVRRRTTCGFGLSHGGVIWQQSYLLAFSFLSIRRLTILGMTFFNWDPSTGYDYSA